MKITIGIPAYNEEKNIVDIVNKLKEKYESIIVCDDGSTDSTYEILKTMNVNIIKHENNLGYGAAINSIFEKSQEIGSDILVTFDADGQHKIDDIETVIAPIIDEKSDISIGSRFLDSKNNVPGYRKVGIKIITHVTNSSIKDKITDSQSGFRAYNKNVLNKIKPLDFGMGISTEILIKASSLGLSITEVPIEILYSGETSTHNPVSHGTSVIISTIKYTSIERPLVFYGIPSVIFLLIGLTFSYMAIQYYVDIGRLSTNLTIVGATTVLIGIVLLIFGFGVYELFISEIDFAKDKFADSTLKINSLDQLKNKIIKVIIIVLIVKFFEKVLKLSHNFPLTIGLSASFSICVFFHSSNIKSKKSISIKVNVFLTTWSTYSPI